VIIVVANLVFAHLRSLIPEGLGDHKDRPYDDIIEITGEIDGQNMY
jgi:hypothetical protein